MSGRPTIGIIGGSGLYEIEGVDLVEERTVETPFGAPSSPISIGQTDGIRVAFLARHGIGHVLNPSEVNYRANIHALKQVGVERVISVSACGSLREDFQPGEIVIPDQLFDNTHLRPRTFFEGGLVAHVDVAEPFCSDLSAQLADSIEAVGGAVHRGGGYITIEGPRFSTRVESHTYRSWGLSIVGMTTSPEAFLAREAELCYSVMAHITDYDVWRTTEEPVTAEMVFKVISANTDLAKRALLHLLHSMPDDRACDCNHALKSALTTDPSRITPQARKRLSLLVEPYLH
jgi:5'-methylthioadenosine phosphorylase